MENKTYGATLRLESVEGAKDFLMTVEWDVPLREVLEECGGEENLPPAYSMMAFLVDKVIDLVKLSEEPREGMAH